jgi:hypothetical protein
VVFMTSRIVAWSNMPSAGIRSSSCVVRVRSPSPPRRENTPRTYREIFPVTVRVLRIERRVRVRLQRAARISPEIRVVGVLPVVPDLVDHLRVRQPGPATGSACVDVGSLTAWCIQNNGSFAEKVGPGVQFAGALTGHWPPRSLQPAVRHQQACAGATVRKTHPPMISCTAP